MEMITPEFQLPGFRFHPTEEELIDYYLRKIVLGKKSYYNIIGFLNIYHHDPWDLPGLAKIGEREWYFFVPRDRKSGNGGKPSRTTQTGYWKATGSDRTIRCIKEPKKILGLRKTLVFYTGRAPKGCKTDWVMNEYRLPNSCSLPSKLEDIVLCKVYRKATSLKVLEQRAAVEEVARSSHITSLCFPTQDTISFYDQQNNNFGMSLSLQEVVHKAEEEVVAVAEKEWNNNNNVDSPYLRVGSKKEKLIELQLPKFSGDWNVDTFGSQLRSPWLDNWNPCAMW